jgi:DEAD/DEAH box helicase domain-containing protein
VYCQTSNDTLPYTHWLARVFALFCNTRTASCPLQHTTSDETKTHVASCLFVPPLSQALAQDQYQALQKILQLHPILCDAVRCGVLDGDTRHDERHAVIGSCNLIFTNPDMLHVSILPNHQKMKGWRSFLGNLRHIVIDESHMYRGHFGSHVACVLRRLLRVCAIQRSALRAQCHRSFETTHRNFETTHRNFDTTAPQFYCCSATIANPAEHFRNLIPIHIHFEGSLNQG